MVNSHQAICDENGLHLIWLLIILSALKAVQKTAFKVFDIEQISESSVSTAIKSDNTKVHFFKERKK